jgi:hypothetical protein
MLISKVEADLEVCMGDLSSFVDRRDFTHDKLLKVDLALTPPPTKIVTVSVSHHHANRLKYKALTLAGMHMHCSSERWQNIICTPQWLE